VKFQQQNRKGLFIPEMHQTPGLWTMCVKYITS
jgi:hypothetical protein